MKEIRPLAALLLLSTLLILLLPSCRKESPLDEPLPTGEPLELTIQTAPLRTTEGGDAEAMISHADVYLYKVSDNTPTLASHFRIEPKAGSGVLHKALSFDDLGATYRICVIANAPEGLLTGRESYEQIMTKTIETPPTADVDLLSGVSGDFIPSDGRHVDVVLLRLTARIKLVNRVEGSDFHVLAVVPYSPQTTTLFPSKEKDHKSSTLAKGKEVSAGDRKELSLLLYESFLAEGGTSTYGGGLLVKASFKGKESWYRIALMDSRGQQIIRRNSLYTIEIREANAVGYDSPEDAIAHTPSNLLLGITSLDTPLKEAGQIVTDGEYFIAATHTELHLGSRANYTYEVNGKSYATDPNDRQSTQKIILRTNIPASKGFKILGQIDYSYDKDDDPDRDEWISISVLEGGQLDYHFRGLYIDDRWGRLTPGDLIAARYKRTARVTIGVDGHPNLHLPILFTQTMDELIQDRLLVYPSLITGDSQRDQTYDVTIEGYKPGYRWEVLKASYLSGPKDWISCEPMSGLTGRDRHLLVRSRRLPETHNTGEAVVKIKLTDREGKLVDIKTIRISTGQALDYSISYPRGLDDLSRSYRVIETPLDQDRELTYTIQVQSVTPWHVERPAGDEWVSLSTPSVGDHSSTSPIGYNGSFTVTLKPNNQGYPIGGLYPARQSVVRIISERASKDILVYQGGYVRIGNTIWMDRNLMSSARKDPLKNPMTYTGSIYLGDNETRGVTGTKGYILPTNGYWNYKISEILYPTAVPIAFDANVRAGYAKHKKPIYIVSQPVETYREYPKIAHYFSHRAYSATSWWYINEVYDSNQILEDPSFYTLVSPFRRPLRQDDGYFGGGLPNTFIAWSGNSDNNSVPENAWNAAAEMDKDKTRDPMREPTEKGRYDPCPKGWRTAAYREVDELLRYLSRAPHFYSGGIEDTHIDSDDPKGIFMRDHSDYNNGVYFVTDDNINVWFPFAGHRQASQDMSDVPGSRFSQLLCAGYEGRYWFNFLYGNGNSMYLQMRVTKEGKLRAAIVPDNGYFGGAVRCVEDKDLR